MFLLTQCLREEEKFKSAERDQPYKHMSTAKQNKHDRYPADDAPPTERRHMYESAMMRVHASKDVTENARHGQHARWADLSQRTKISLS